MFGIATSLARLYSNTLYHTGQNPKPHGLLRTPFILKTFAPHFKVIAMTRLKSEPAVGALSMACAAVRSTFILARHGDTNSNLG